MSSLPDSFGRVNDSPADRDLLLNGLRVAATRSRLKITVFDTIHIALRQKRINCAQALQQLKAEGLLAEVPFGAEGAQ
jgi:hypothetical protein